MIKGIIHKRNEKCYAFILGSICGLILYFLFYGVHRLDFTYDTWIYNGGDIAHQYLGWQFFRDGDWQFPIGMTDRMLYPGSASVVYTDSIPLFAVFFKVIRGILPETFQYFGLFGLICFLLQGGMAALIAYEFWKNKVFLICVACLITVSPVMLWRMYAHTALAAHFVILIAIYLWMNSELSWKRAILYWCILGVMTVGLHMYFIPMIGIILIAFCIKRVMERPDEWKHALLLILIFITVNIVVLYVYGGFYGETIASGSGLGIYNANLNTFINSMGHSTFIPQLKVGTSGQYEGFGYLGLGVLLLFCMLTVCQFMQISNLKETVGKSEIISVMWMVTASMILAVSTEVYFGSFHLLSISLPETIEKLLGIFRSSGRFVWIVVYVSIFYVVKWFSRLSKCKYNLLIMGLCCLLQLMDMRQYCFNYVKNDMPVNFAYNNNPIWEYISDHYNTIMILGRQDTSVRFNIASYAVRNHMAVSQVTFARNHDEEINKYVNEYCKRLERGTADKKTLYIFNNFIYKKDYNLHIYWIDDLYVGTIDEIPGLKELNVCDNELKMGFGQAMENGEDSGMGRILHSGGRSYAPNLDMHKGKYKIIVEGENLNFASIKLYSLATGVYFKLTDQTLTSDLYAGKFLLEEDTAYMEIVIENNMNEDIQIRRIIMEEYSETDNYDQR